MGSYVYFRRTQIKPGEHTDYRWFGVCRVIGYEPRNKERFHDPYDVPDHGASSHLIWLRYRQGTVLASPEHLRFATPDELLLNIEIEADFLTPLDPRGARNYVDLTRGTGSESFSAEDGTAVAPPPFFSFPAPPAP